MKAVFDVGMVLIQVYLHWDEVVKRSGVSVSTSLVTNDSIQTFPYLVPYERGAISESDFLEHLRLQFELETRQEALLLHRAVLGEEFPGVHDVVRDLHSSGIETATLSNSSALHWDYLSTSPEYPAFQLIQHKLSSFQLSAFKPDRSIYEKFCDTTGWQPEELVFVDDSPANVSGALDAGWKAHLIDTSKSAAPQLRSIFSL